MQFGSRAKGRLSDILKSIFLCVFDISPCKRTAPRGRAVQKDGSSRGRAVFLHQRAAGRHFDFGVIRVKKISRHFALDVIRSKKVSRHFAHGGFWLGEPQASGAALGEPENFQGPGGRRGRGGGSWWGNKWRGRAGWVQFKTIAFNSGLLRPVQAEGVQFKPRSQGSRSPSSSG